MNAPRYLYLVTVLLLPACAAPTLTSTLPATPVALAHSSLIGVQIPALLPGTAGAVALQQKAELERRLQKTGSRVQVSPLPEDALGLRIAASDTFEAGSAQLKLGALTSYAEIANVLKVFPSSVAHVLVYGDLADSGDAGDSKDPGDVALSVAARRAASIGDYLARRGIPLTRLRAEGRRTAGKSEQVELVLKPVVQGYETQAWTPPP